MNAARVASIAAHFARAKWRSTTLHGEALTRYQEARAQRQIAFAAAHSPFYRVHWADHDLTDWRTLPTIDKSLMMEHFDTFNTRGIRRDEAMAVALAAEQSRDFAPQVAGMTVGLSSGTSGHRGLFVASPAEEAAWAGTILARTLHHLSGRLRVAFFLRSNSNLYETISGALIQFRYFDLMTPLTEVMVRLNLLRPHIVVAPPSLLSFLADALTDGALRIRPQRLISVAEVLDPQERTRLEHAFQAPVHQIYQCTEGLLAISCAHGALHIQEDLVALQCEPLASEEDTTAEDTTAEVTGEERITPIVTDLWRRTQPILRYRLNDVLRLDPRPCACGSDFRVIAQIEGRRDDVCYFARRDGTARAFFPDTIRRMVLLAHASIRDYAAIQERDGHLRVHFQPASGAHAEDVASALRKSINGTLAAYGCEPTTVEVMPGLPEQAPGTKRRRVQRRMTDPPVQSPREPEPMSMQSRIQHDTM